jgi:hypothetical protein
MYSLVVEISKTVDEAVVDQEHNVAQRQKDDRPQNPKVSCIMSDGIRKT